jgi:hypothetical protein
MKNSILDFELIHGTFKATIDSYKEIPALINNSRRDNAHYDLYDTSLPENAVIRDAYLSVTLRLETGDTLETRWFSKRIPYISRCLRNQLGDHLYKLSDILKAAHTQPFTVHIEIDPRYGQQIEYDA